MSVTDETIYVFIDCPFAIVSLIFTTLIIVILHRLEDRENKIFTYLKYESIFVFVDCFIIALLPLYKSSQMIISPAVQCVLKEIMFNFLSGTVELSSLIMAIFSALTLFLLFETTSNRFLSYLLLPKPYITAVIVFITSSLIFGHYLTVFQIFSVHQNQSTTDFSCSNSINSSMFYNVMTLVSFGLNNGPMVLVLIFVNALVLVKTKKRLGNKSIGLNSNSKRISKEKNLTKLILADCANLIFGRIPLFIYLFIVLNKIRISFFLSLTVFTTLLSYTFKFFLFYHFNNRFRNETLKILSFIIRKR